MSIVSNSPRWATYAHLALPTCSLRCWKISRGIRPHREHKEPLDEHSIELHARILRLAENRTGRHGGDSAPVLVGAARTMGEPLDLCRTPGRGHSLSARFFHQHGLSAAPHARRMAPRLCARARCIRHALRVSGGTDHGYSSYRGNFLLSRRPVWRAPRPQHPVLEVASGFRSHHRALEAHHSYRHSAASQFRHHHCHAVHYAPAGQHNAAWERREHRDALDTGVVHSRVTGSALSPSHGSWSLVRAPLWLATTGFGLGAARAIFMGLPAAVRDLRSGKDCVQHFAFPRSAAVPLAGAGGRHGAAQCPAGFYGNTHSDPFLQHAGSVDRAGTGRGISLCSGPAAPLSRTDLSHITLNCNSSHKEKRL